MIYVFGHKSPDTDSICSAIAYAELKKQLGMEAEAFRLGVVNKETEFVLEYFGIKHPELIGEGGAITDVEGKQVILVDHNESGQSAKGRDKSEILEIIDHHRLCSIETVSPLYVRMEPVGCTSTVVYKLYQENKIKPTRDIAGIMLSAILSDTLIFKSPTCTEEDKKAANELSEIADIADIQNYGEQMLMAATSLEGYTPDELLEIDRKKFTFGEGVTAYISQINTLDFDSTIKLKDDLLKAMDLHLQETEGDLAIVMITDLKRNSSELLVIGKKIDLARKAFSIDADKDCIHLDGVVSRKKQIIPLLTALG